MSEFTAKAQASIAELHATGLLDSPPEEQFERINAMVGRLLHVPTALVTLIDANRQFFKASSGLPEPWATRRETPLTHSFCQYVVLNEVPLQVQDARLDPLVRDNLAVTDLGVIAYLGMPLRSNGITIGSLCAIDGKPRQWTSDDFATLRDLAVLVERQIALRVQLGALREGLAAPLARLHQIAMTRAADAALPAEVRADFAAVAEAIARQGEQVAGLIRAATRS